MRKQSKNTTYFKIITVVSLKSILINEIIFLSIDENNQPITLGIWKHLKVFFLQINLSAGFHQVYETKDFSQWNEEAAVEFQNLRQKNLNQHY